MAETVMTFHTDNRIKKQAVAVFKRLGLDIDTAINLFLRKSIVADGMPFSVTGKNDATTPHLREVRRLIDDPKTKRFANFDELLADLDNDDE